MSGTSKQAAISYFRQKLSRNKAIGVLAELNFTKEIIQNYGLSEKMVEGCWIFTPPADDFFKKRRAFFLHWPRDSDQDHISVPRTILDASHYLRSLGIASSYAIPDLSQSIPFKWKVIDLSTPTLGTPQPLEKFMTDFPRKLGLRRRGSKDLDERI
ncbi:MAG: hypothetical protein HMLIMOIP_000927 [Candidatus Nitrosomirales archaeon]|jgi:hypothetical protein